MKKTTKRRLRPWVKATIKGFIGIVAVIALTFGFMCIMTEAHDQRAQYWSEVGGY